MKKAASIPEPLVIEQSYYAPIEKVWDAITVKEQMQQWYFKPIKEFRAQPGFETRFNVEHNGKNYPHHWKIVEVVPGKKISYEWLLDGHPGNSQVTFELFAEGDKTRLVLTHIRLETFLPEENPDLSRGNFEDGWAYFTGEALKGFLEKGIIANK